MRPWREAGLDLAAERFRAALESLENAAGSVGESLDSAAKLPERVAELEAERERLLAKIAELEEEITVLSGLTEESGRASRRRHRRNSRRVGPLRRIAMPLVECHESTTPAPTRSLAMTARKGISKTWPPMSMPRRA